MSTFSMCDIWDSFQNMIGNVTWDVTSLCHFFNVWFVTKLLIAKGSNSLKVRPRYLQKIPVCQVYGCLSNCYYCQQLCKSPHTIFFHDFLISVLMQCPKIGTTLQITGRKNGFVLFLAFSAQYTEPGRQCRMGMC